jgi:hypothetical protein
VVFVFYGHMVEWGHCIVKSLIVEESWGQAEGVANKMNFRGLLKILVFYCIVFKAEDEEVCLVLQVRRERRFASR